MTLELFKVEKGYFEGDVLYHKFGMTIRSLHMYAHVMNALGQCIKASKRLSNFRSEKHRNVQRKNAGERNKLQT
jgi:hypothetical protein